MPPSKTDVILNALTVDVEDYFHVHAFSKIVHMEEWDSFESRVEKNTHLILDLLDSSNGQRLTDNGEQKEVRTTFFILGWLAERLPHLVREIHSRGHEVASHGYCHNLCNEESWENLRADLSDSKKLLEDIIGAPVFGYRAPSFSIDDDVLKIIEDSGYLYDSSYNSFGMHKRYGRVTLSDNGRRGIAFQLTNDFCEIPVSNLTIAKKVLPWGGGGYFRMIPFSLFKTGVQSILKRENAYVFYMHPWEIDPEQPKVNHASWGYKLRHYINLNKSQARLTKLIAAFNQCNFITCHEYLDWHRLQGN